jgi:hypothetical protein
VWSDLGHTEGQGAGIMSSTRIDTTSGNDCVMVEDLARPDEHYVCMQVMSESLWISVARRGEIASMFIDLDDAEQALETMLNAVRSRREQLEGLTIN